MAGAVFPTVGADTDVDVEKAVPIVVGPGRERGSFMGRRLEQPYRVGDSAVSEVAEALDRAVIVCVTDRSGFVVSIGEVLESRNVRQSVKAIKTQAFPRRTRNRSICPPR